MHALKTQVRSEIGGDIIKVTDPNHHFKNFKERLQDKVKKDFGKAMTVPKIEAVVIGFVRAVYQ